MKIFLWVTAIVTVFLGTGIAHAAGKTSVELGQELFNDAKLSGSTNESSCSSCHGGGKGLENAGENKKLTKLINSCLVDRMAGEKMDGRKADMRSLKMYIQSLHN